MKKNSKIVRFAFVVILAGIAIIINKVNGKKDANPLEAVSFEGVEHTVPDMPVTSDLPIIKDKGASFNMIATTKTSSAPVAPENPYLPKK
jgi:hypothetical protein